MKALVIALLAVTLAWQDNSGNESGFLVEKTISGNCIDGFFEVARVGVDIAMWVDEIAQPGDCYRVAAFNGDGTSGYTNTAQVPVVEQPPKPCTNKGKKCR